MRPGALGQILNRGTDMAIAFDQQHIAWANHCAKGGKTIRRWGGICAARAI